MRDEGPHPSSPFRPRTSLPLRLRGALRAGTDLVLGADLVWSAAFVLVMLLLVESQHCGGASYERFEAGEIVPHDIPAAEDFEIRDEELTENRRQAAIGRVPDVYVLDTERGSRLSAEIARVFEEGRRIEGDTSGAASELLGRRIGEAAFDVLRRHGFSPEIERALVSCLERVHREAIVVNRALLEQEPSILLMRVPGGGEESVSGYSSLLDLDQARRQAREELRAAAILTPAERETLADLAASYVDANLSYDAQETSSRREAAAASVPPVLLRVPQGTLLARKGERLPSESVKLIEAACQNASRRFGLAELMGMLTVVSMLAFFLHRYSHYHQRHFRRIKNLHALLVLVLILMTLLGQGLLWVVRGVVDDLSDPFNQVESYTYLIPFGGGAILVALLANAGIAVVYSTFASVLFGALTGWDSLRMVWALLVQLAGVYAISTYRERTALLRAGLVVGSAAAAAALAVEGLAGAPDPFSRTAFGAALAFVGGTVGGGLLVSFVLPVFEGLFHALTDIRLLELSNVNHPLLSELAVKAPGSYNHSVVVGTLAQEAAKAIGANPLFCRVAAYYHDIGKMQKPEYYVENQHGANPHDRLSPSMSALIIAAHVKDGIRLAREAGLPHQIVDIIPQHHGTRLMTYFYDRARKSADPSLGPVNEDDFRYPGPKPRTAEAAIFMLADAVEAAARTVDDPSPGRLRDVIRKVTSSIVLDRQLDECELTFADLERIQEALLRTLMGMHHHRLDYPGFSFGRPEGETRSGEVQDPRMAGGW